MLRLCLESELKQSRFIEQVMVIGEGEKMPAALIQVNFDFAKEWANRKQLNAETILYNDKFVNVFKKKLIFTIKNLANGNRLKDSKLLMMNGRLMPVT